MSDELENELLAALKEISLRFGALVLASGDFSEANARAIDQANTAIAKADSPAMTPSTPERKQ